MQCLIDIFGPEKADRLTKEKPSEEDMKKMAPCMEPGKTKTKTKRQKRSNRFWTSTNAMSYRCVWI